MVAINDSSVQKNLCAKWCLGKRTGGGQEQAGIVLIEEHPDHARVAVEYCCRVAVCHDKQSVRREVREDEVRAL